MLYSRKKKWFFVHVPKNAGTSILHPFHREIKSEDERKVVIENRATQELSTIVGHHHHNKADYWLEYPELANLTPVAILRNPWDRALSIYTYNLKETSRNLHTNWGRLDHGRLIKEGFKRSWMPGGFFVDGHGRETEYNEQTGRAWGQDDDQYSWLDGKGKWFRMEDQLGDFCNYTGLPHPDRINTTKRSHYHNYYDKELVDRIGELFSRDIKLGGYKY